MSKVAVEREVACSVETAFRVICDVESYPQFVPGVESMTRESKGGSAGNERFKARAQVKSRHFAGAITSDVSVDRKAGEVDLTVNFGFIKIGTATWTIHGAGDVTKVRCELKVGSMFPGMSFLTESRVEQAANAFGELFAQRMTSEQLRSAA